MRRGADLPGALSKAEPLHAVYLTPGLEEWATHIAPDAGKVVACGSARMVGRGCTLAVEEDGLRSRVVVGLRDTRSRKLNFSANLLRLARVVR